MNNDDNKILTATDASVQIPRRYLLFDREKRVGLCVTDGIPCHVYDGNSPFTRIKICLCGYIVYLYPRINFHQTSPTGLLPTRCDFGDVACTVLAAAPSLRSSVTCQVILLGDRRELAKM